MKTRDGIAHITPFNIDSDSLIRFKENERSKIHCCVEILEDYSVGIFDYKDPDLCWTLYRWNIKWK